MAAKRIIFAMQRQAGVGADLRQRLGSAARVRLAGGMSGQPFVRLPSTSATAPAAFEGRAGEIR